MIDRAPMVRLLDLAEGKMDPYKRQAHLGPGPRGRSVSKRRKDRFKCQCTSRGDGTECACKHRRGVKHVFVSYDYKNDYNADYRRWAKKKSGAKKPKKPGLLKRAAGALKKIVGL